MGSRNSVFQRLREGLCNLLACQSCDTLYLKLTLRRSDGIAMDRVREPELCPDCARCMLGWEGAYDMDVLFLEDLFEITSGHLLLYISPRPHSPPPALPAPDPHSYPIYRTSRSIRPNLHIRHP